MLFFSLLAFSLLITCSANIIPVCNGDVAQKYLCTVDQSINPCENFYGYACHNFIKTHGDDDFKSTQTIQKSRLDSILLQAVKDISTEDPDQRDIITKRFFDLCIATGDHPNWLKQLYDAVATRIGPLTLFEDKASDAERKPNASHAWKLAGVVHWEFSISVYGALHLSYDEHLNLYPNLESRKVCQHPEDLEQHVLEQAEAIGADNEKVKSKIGDWLKAVLALCRDLNNTIKNQTDIDYEPITFENVSKTAPNFDLDSFLRGALSAEAYERLIKNRKVPMAAVGLKKFDHLGQAFARHSTEAVHSLAFLTALHDMADWPINRSELEAGKKRIDSGEKPFDVFGSKCYEVLKEGFSPALARLYFEKIGRDIAFWSHQLSPMAQNIIGAFEELIEKSDWLDEKEKADTRNYTRMQTLTPILPYWIGDVAEVMKRLPEAKSGATIFNMEFDRRKKLHELDLQRPKGSIFISPDAPYPALDIETGYTYNRFHVDLGLALPPIFDVDYPPVLKYGGLGFAIAHEFMHAFDHWKFLFGRFRHQTLKNSSLEELKRRFDCLVEQYSSYCDKHGKCINGSATLTENAADVMAVKVAYAAYKKLSYGRCDIPGFENHTNDQMFFVWFARFMCASGHSDEKSKMLEPYSPREARVRLALANFPVFASAFRCPPPPRDAPSPPICPLWGHPAETYK